jgi:putative DNA primase/helicase
MFGRNRNGAYGWWRDPDPDSLILLPDDLRELVGLLHPPANHGPSAVPMSMTLSDFAQPGWGNDSAFQETTLEGLVDRAVERSKTDGRNNAGFWLACQLRDNGLTEAEAEQVMVRYAARVPRYNAKGDGEPYTKTEALATLRSAYSRPARQSRPATPPSSAEADTPAPTSSVITAPAAESVPPPARKPRLVPPTPLVKITASRKRIKVSPLSVNLLHYRHNDTANGLRLRAMYGPLLRYCPERRKWIVWRGTHWEVDRSGQAMEWAKATMTELLAQALKASTDPSRDPLIRFANGSLNARRLKDLVELAQSSLFVHADQLDSNPNLLCVGNGTLDLCSFELRDYLRDDFITKLIPIRYKPEAQCPQFLKFLDRIMGGPGATADRLVYFLQKSLGMCLTGDVSEKVVFCLFGSGNNGKTTLLEAIRFVLGPYAAQILIDSLLAHAERESNNSMADLADLKGTRFCTTSEVGEGQHLDEGRLKYLTAGMGSIKTARKYENPIQFPVTHKLFADANHRPVVNGSDDAVWNRLKCIPFDVVIPPDEIDPHLLDKLKAEAEGILAWLVQGCWLWRQERLGDPPEVTGAGSEWRSEMDTLGQFVDEMCVLDPGFHCSARALRRAYEEWAKENGHKFSVSPRKFNERLVKLGCVETRHRYGRAYPERAWKGIDLRVHLCAGPGRP